MTEMLKEIKEQPEVLKRCIENSKELISEIVKEINARNIQSVFMAARGTSDHAAIYGKYIIEHELGLPVALAAPSILTIYNRDVNLKNSLVIGISQSGKAEDVLEVIKKAKSQGALSLSITNNCDSPLAKTADFHLFADAQLEKSVAATKTFTAQMMLLALLTAIWADNKDFLNELSQVPKNLKQVLKLESLIEERAQRYRYMEDGFVLARGINYPAALEGALKIQETTYVRAKGYAISDFHHGPFAMVERGTPVIVFAPKGASLKDAKEMAQKLHDIDAEIILVTNAKEEFQGLNTIVFEIPDTSNDLISPFYNVVWAQIFACKLALSKGLNPDAPRGLKKVTITR